MGLFNFSKYTDSEKKLFELYFKTMSNLGLSSTEIKKMVETMLDQAIAESQKEGTYYLPNNFGDIILENAESDNLTINKIAENLKQKISKKKVEGVKDKDIKWFWNLSDVERRMMLKQDDISKTALFIEQRENGKTADMAAAKVRKFHAMFGDIDDTSVTTGDDRPLPHELKDRINIYIIKQTNENLEKYKSNIESATTFNSLIRKEIKAGNL